MKTISNYIKEELFRLVSNTRTNIKDLQEMIDSEAYFTEEQLFTFLKQFKGFKDEGGFEKETNSTITCKMLGKKYIIDIFYIKEHKSYQIVNYLQINR